MCKQLKSSHLDSVICIPVLQSIRLTLKEYNSSLLSGRHFAVKIHGLPCPQNSLIILLTLLCCYASLHLLVLLVIVWWLLLFLFLNKWTAFISPAHHEHISFCYISRTACRSEEAARRPGLQLSERDPQPPVGVPTTTLIPFLQVHFESDECLNWLFSAEFTKRPQPQCRKNLARSLSAQQPMFRACCPVPVLGGVIRPSAPHWHERVVFILDQSVCLFIKGFDHSTPWPPGSN